MKKAVFERYEKKYLITNTQREALISALADYIVPDEYGAYTISNIYYDTDSYELIRASIEKPVYKEKLRLRSYGTPKEDDMVFLELKKKYKGIVYKRRLTLPYHQAVRLLQKTDVTDGSQILSEIEYFLSQYPVSEKAFICYDRVAYTGVENHDLRITFDTNIRFRQIALQLDEGTWGDTLLSQDQVIMEIKIPGVFPIWLSSLLSTLEVFPISFSKYGSCYKEFIANELLREKGCA